MSEFHVRVVELGPVTKHPNADSLSLTTVGGEGGYPVILRTGEFHEGDRAVYVPVGAAVPLDDPRWSFLANPGSTKPYTEIDAKRLRGIFSMGILTRAEPSWAVGQDVSMDLRIERAEAVDASSSSSLENEADPGLMPTYTDIDGLRQHPHALQDGEDVVLVTKIHGENARYCVDDARLYCGSRTRWKAPAARTAWTTTAERLGLEQKLRALGGHIGVYGELYGNVTGMRYDASASERGLRLFDAMDLRQRRYLDYDDFAAVADQLGLLTAPVLYRGSWSRELVSHADGPDLLNPTHVREGFVVRPAHERTEHMGRVILKYHGEAYLLKKWKV
jgi:RNA ligase (TIGR02306 family)